MKISINALIYIYMLICFSLLLYNIIYIIKSYISKKLMKKRSFYWKGEILKQISFLQKQENVEESHLRKLERKLSKTEELIAYVDALDSLNEHDTFEIYLQNTFVAQQTLALKYAKKDSMNRAFFAYTISKYPSCIGEKFRPIMRILISYLDNSTVYCRENSLKALCALGNIQAVENALQILNDYHWFHHKKLLSDGLATFRGDKEKLMEVLWKHINDWDENIMISVVQFITICGGQYQEVFFPMLLSDNTSIEIRLGIMRYYRRYFYEPVREILYSFLQDDNIDENLIIVAAIVLDRYPGEETIDILKEALHHHNWYVRRNAASSLYNLGVELDTLDNILNGDDRYAKDMLNYKYQVKAGEVVS